MNSLKKILVFFIFIFLIFVSCKKDCIEVEVPYTVEEEYTDIEMQDIHLKYESGKLYHSRIGGAILFGENPQYEIECSVTNTSEYGGKFKLYATLSSQGDILKFSEEAYIGAGVTHDYEATKEINPYTFEANVEVIDWGIVAPVVSVEKEVIKYKDVKKYRKCNTCVEDCGSKYDSVGIPWWGYLLIVFVIVFFIWLFSFVS